MNSHSLQRSLGKRHANICNWGCAGDFGTKIVLDTAKMALFLSCHPTHKFMGQAPLNFCTHCKVKLPTQSVLCLLEGMGKTSSLIYIGYCRCLAAAALLIHFCPAIIGGVPSWTVSRGKIAAEGQRFIAHITIFDVRSGDMYTSKSFDRWQ